MADWRERRNLTEPHGRLEGEEELNRRGFSA
jgi:hypothetical protein